MRWVLTAMSIYHDFHIKPVGRGPMKNKGAPERVMRTEMMKASGAD